MSSRWVTISKPDLLSSSKTGVNLGIRSWKKHFSDWARCQTAIGGIYFTKKWRAETLQPGLEFDNFKPPASKRYLQMHLLAERFVYWRWWSGFSERGNQALFNGTNDAYSLANFFSFFTSIVYACAWCSNANVLVKTRSWSKHIHSSEQQGVWKIENSILWSE